MKISTVAFGELVLIPFQATSITEYFEWLTDLQTSRDGSENAIKLRQLPRQYFSYTIPTNNVNRDVLFSTIWGGVRSNVALPLWTESQSVGNITAGQITITCDTVKYDLQDSSVAMLFTSNNDFEIVDIISTTSTTVTLNSGASARQNANLIPVKPGYTKGTPEWTNNSSFDAVRLEVEVRQVRSIPSDAPLQYLSYDIRNDPGDTANSANVELIEQNLDLTDFGISNIEYYTSWTIPKRQRGVTFILEGIDEIYAHKQRLFSLSGREGKFWHPSSQSDIRIKDSGTITTSILVWTDNLIDYMTNRTHIAFYFSNDWHYREILSSSVIDSTTLQLNIDSALNVDASLISCISWAGLFRQNSDRQMLKWYQNNICEAQSKIAEISI